MTGKAVPSTQPEALTDTAAEQLRGGALTSRERPVGSVKDDRPSPSGTGFIPSAGTSRMD